MNDQDLIFGISLGCGNKNERTTKCIIHGSDKEDIFLFLLSATDLHNRYSSKQ